MDEVSLAEEMFEEFWTRYQRVDTMISPAQPRRTIPVFVHGDEGRGLVKRPIMVVSIQPIIGSSGENTTNNRRHLGIDFNNILACYFEFRSRVSLM